MKVSIIYDFHDGSVTGGRRYEALMLQCMGESPEVDVSRHIFRRKCRPLWAKPFLPLVNAFRWKAAKGASLVIFNSVEFIYMTPLQWIIRHILRKPTAIVHHHFLYMEFSGLKRRIFKFLEARFLKGADFLIIPSPYVLDLCRQRFPDVRQVYWQIPFDAPDSADAPAPRKGQLLFIGTIEPRKGLHFLMEALSVLRSRGRNYPLTIVGRVVNEDYCDSLKSVVRENSLDVDFAGFVSPEELHDLYSSSDLFVFPSQLEGYGMVIGESMSHGLPVVAFDNSAMPYTVRDGYNGALVPDRDVSAFADAIENIVENRDLRARLSDNAHTFAASLPTTADFRQRISASLPSLLHPND